MSNNQSMSAIGNLGKEIYNADKSGNLKDYGINKALDYMSNNQSNSLSDSTLAPNQTGIVKADSTSLFSDQPKSILDTINEQNTSSVGLYNQPSASLFSDQPKSIIDTINDQPMPGLFGDQPKSIADTINEQNTSSVDLYKQPMSGLFSDQPKPVDKQGNIVPAAPVIGDGTDGTIADAGGMFKNVHEVDNKLVRQLKNADGSLSDKYVNIITGEVSYKKAKDDAFAGVKEDNSDNEKLANSIQKNGPVTVNPVSAAMDAINLGKPIVDSGSIIDTIAGDNKPLGSLNNPISDTISTSTSTSSSTSTGDIKTLGKVNGIMDTITKNNKPLDGLGKVNGIMAAVAGDSKSLGENIDNNQMMQPQLNKRGTALMNLVFKDNENEKGAVTSLLNGVYGMSERIKSNPLSSKTGWGGFVNKSVNGFSDLLFGGGGGIDESENQITGFNPKESIQLYNSNPKLVPNNADKAKVNGYVSSVNQQYQDMKDNKSSTKASGSSDNQLKGNANPGSSGKKSNLDGMSTNIVTRNPDSIFRSVSMSIMKTTLT